MAHVRHLYVHLPFCGHRCGYCDFVTAVGHRELHGPYVDAVLGELELERDVLADRVETVFVGGGTPSFTALEELRRLLAALPSSDELTVEANPETVTTELARLLRDGGVTRVSLGVQTFHPRLLEVLERSGTPDDARRAFELLRDVGFDDLSLDLLYGIPGQAEDDLADDLADALALEPEHVSCYELEAKPGTRFTHAHGEELEHQADAMEGYFERVVEVLTSNGYRWYETANFCREPALAGGRDHRARHNLAYWRGRDYLGVGVGAVSTISGERRRNLPGLGGYVSALAGGRRPPHDVELLDEVTSARERLLLGLRLDEPLAVAGLGAALDETAVERLVSGGLVSRVEAGAGLTLSRRGRFLGGAVTAELVSW